MCKYFFLEHLRILIRKIWESERLIGSSFSSLSLQTTVLQFITEKTQTFSVTEKSLFLRLFFNYRSDLASGLAAEVPSWLEGGCISYWGSELKRCWASCRFPWHCLAARLFVPHGMWFTLPWLNELLGFTAAASENRSHMWDTGFKGSHILVFKMLSWRMCFAYWQVRVLFLSSGGVFQGMHRTRKSDSSVPCCRPWGS